MTHAGAVSRRFRVQVSKYLTGGSHVCFFYSSRPIFPTFVVTISRFVLRPACLYPILQYIYVFFNTTFPPLDGNRCHSLNRPTAYRNPDPSLSLSLSLHIFVLRVLGSARIPIVFLPEDCVHNITVRIVEGLPYGFILGARFFYANKSILNFGTDKGFKPTPASPWVPFLDKNMTASNPPRGSAHNPSLAKTRSSCSQ